MEAREKHPRYNSEGLEQGPGSTWRDTQNSIFDLLNPKQTEDVSIFIPEKVAV